jgi:hypothetical protein
LFLDRHQDRIAWHAGITTPVRSFMGHSDNERNLRSELPGQSERGGVQQARRS